MWLPESRWNVWPPNETSGTFVVDGLWILLGIAMEDIQRERPSVWTPSFGRRTSNGVRRALHDIGQDIGFAIPECLEGNGVDGYKVYGWGSRTR